MDIDELKDAWQSLERELATNNALLRRSMTAKRARRVKLSLWPLVVGQATQLLAGLALTPLFASFWFEHRDAPHLMLCGIVMQAYSTILMILAARELHLVFAVDPTEPVVAIQRKVESLRTWRIRVGPFFAVTGCFIWIPLMLVIFASLGADVWTRQPSVVAWFVASGMVPFIALVAYWLWARRPAHRERAHVLADHVAGATVRRAREALAEIAAFERGE